MELINGQELMEFLQTTKEEIASQALNCPDPMISLRLYAMSTMVDMVMDRIFDGNFDLDMDGETVQ